jgi:Na+/proline symporter
MTENVMKSRGQQSTMVFQNLYTWLVLMATLDLLMTAAVLAAGGWEVNSVAAYVMHRFGLVGIVWYKFGLVALIILLCETVGRRSARAGWILGTLAVVLTAAAVATAFRLLLWMPA